MNWAASSTICFSSSVTRIAITLSLRSFFMLNKVYTKLTRESNKKYSIRTPLNVRRQPRRPVAGLPGVLVTNRACWTPAGGAVRCQRQGHLRRPELFSPGTKRADVCTDPNPELRPSWQKKVAGFSIMIKIFFTAGLARRSGVQKVSKFD